MKIVIDIRESFYNQLLDDVENANISGVQVGVLERVIANGTPLLKGHGDLVDRDRVIDLLHEQEYNYYTELDKVTDTVYEADVIIEADKEVGG